MPKLLKDLYDKKLIRSLSGELKKAYPSFNSAKFGKRIFNDTWNGKELKQRMRHISQTLHKFLPDDYPKAKWKFEKGIRWDNRTMEIPEDEWSDFETVPAWAYSNSATNEGLKEMDNSPLLWWH